MSTRFLTRVGLQNYKSIATCNVELQHLTFLIGPNGSGKSNFLDALRFVADALRSSLDHALRDRGGIKEVRRRSGGHPTHFAIRLDFMLDSFTRGYYAFRIAARKQSGYEVQDERCELFAPLKGKVRFHVHDGEVVDISAPVAPAATRDRLYLVNASGLPEFKSVYDALSSMGFYNINPDTIRDLQSPDAGELLARDGSNLASVLAQMKSRHPTAKKRVEEYLSNVAGVSGVNAKEMGPKLTLEFRQPVSGADHPWRFLAANMSDGTLRALGVLVALFQKEREGETGVRLVGIEEPEAALHPAATGVLLDGLRDASNHTQIIVTSHSPDLLDDENIQSDSILAVTAEQGNTIISPVDSALRAALHKQLYTAGELLRLNQLTPDIDAANAAARQLRLFAEVEN